MTPGDVASLLDAVHLRARRWRSVALAVAVVGAIALLWGGHHASAVIAKHRSRADSLGALATLHLEHEMAWRGQAQLAAARVRVDSVLVDHWTEGPTDTLWTPAPPPIGESKFSAIPMPVIAKWRADSLHAYCSRLAGDCSTALAAKDSALEMAASGREALRAQLHDTEKIVSAQKWESRGGKVKWGLAGVGLGVAACIVHFVPGCR